MNSLLSAQYNEIKGARGALFSYCRSMDNADLFKGVADFNDKTIISLLVHNANTYVHWLAQLDKSADIEFVKTADIKDMDAIEKTYQLVDTIVNDFLIRYSTDYTLPFTQNLPRKEYVVTVTPLQLFTHVITHEFHHKGQILTMSRLLGYTPVDTDVIRT
jgi:uncharacterized damage-inducible protein DinB